jgi:hypothetical protein
VSVKIVLALALLFAAQIISSCYHLYAFIVQMRSSPFHITTVKCYHTSQKTCTSHSTQHCTKKAFVLTTIRPVRQLIQVAARQPSFVRLDVRCSVCISQGSWKPLSITCAGMSVTKTQGLYLTACNVCKCKFMQLFCARSLLVGLLHFRCTVYIRIGPTDVQAVTMLIKSSCPCVHDIMRACHNACMP